MSQTPRYAAQSRFGRRVGPMAGLLLSLVALTGCVAVELTVSVSSDNTVSGTSRIGVSKSLVDLAGGRDAVLNELRSSRPCRFGDRTGTVKDFDDGTYVGIDCAFAKVGLADFNNGQDGPKIERAGGTFRMTGTFDLQDVANAATQGGATPSSLPTDLASLLPTDLASLLPTSLPTDPASLLPSDSSGLGLGNLLGSAKIAFAFTFPGDVTSSRGQIQGRSVTFKPDGNGRIDFETVAGAVGPASGPALATPVWIGLVASGLLLALGGLLAFARRRRAAALQRERTPVYSTLGGKTTPGGWSAENPGEPGQGHPLSGFGPEYGADEHPPGPPQPWASPPGPPQPWASPPGPPQPWASPPSPPQPPGHRPADPPGEPPYLAPS